jgi:integrase
MADDINVIVVDRGRRFLYLRYTCPVTGDRIEKSSGETSEKEARKRAGEWQAELLAGGGGKTTATWEAFREAYESGKVFNLRSGTADKVSCMFNVVESIMKPDSVKRITRPWLTEFQKRLLDAGRSPATVESHCRHLKAALNWARDEKLIQTVPQFPKLNKVRSAKVMKGRPITGEEFDRMILAVDVLLKMPINPKPEVRQRKELQRESVRFLLRGLWLSGLRLNESLSLTWDQWADGIRVDMSGDHVFLLIPAESEKGGQDRVYPVTPDFAELLRSVPENQRSGFVFNPLLHRGQSRRRNSVSDLIRKLGESAQIKVDQKADLPIWASAHDLRRAFGARWARRVSSMVLKDLMRHASVSTTEKYYVGINAAETAAMLAGMLPPADIQVTGDTTDKKAVRGDT